MVGHVNPRHPWCWRGCPVITRREVWLPVHVRTRHRWGHTYQVSNLGRVCSINPRTGARRLLAIYVHNTGYLAVSLGTHKRDEHGRRVGGCFLVHQLVARAFLGPPPRDGQVWEVDHLDFDRTSAVATGLRWLLKDTNAWRWKFWADECPPDWAEEPPPTPEQVAEHNAMLKANGWPIPAPPRPDQHHRHPEKVTA